MPDELRPFPCACPFCGGHKLKVDSRASEGRFNHKTGKVEKTHTASLRCNKCHARGPTVSVKLPVGEYGALEMLEDKAIEAWNGRVIVPDAVTASCQEKEG